MSIDRQSLLSKEIEAQLKLTMRQVDQLTKPYLPELVRGQVGAELLALLVEIQQLLPATQP